METLIQEPFTQNVLCTVAVALRAQKPIAFWGYNADLIGLLHSHNLLEGLNALFVSDRPEEQSIKLGGYSFKYYAPDKLKDFKPEKIILLPRNAVAITIYEKLVRHYSYTPNKIMIHPSNFGKMYYSSDMSAWNARASVPESISGYIGEDILLHLYDGLKYIAKHNIPGDIINLGVYQGWSMHALAQLRDKLGLQDRCLWGFDTFKGFVPSKSYDFFQETFAIIEPILSSRSTILNADTSVDLVQDNLRAFKNIKLIEGDISETIIALKDVPISVALFDMDDYTPTMAALPTVYERLSRPGFIVFDHYNWSTTAQGACLGQRFAMLDFNSDGKLFNPIGTNLFIKT